MLILFKSAISMFKKLDSFLRRKTDEVVFIELREGKKIEFKGVIIDNSVPLPVLLKNIKEKIDDIKISDFKLDDFIDGMAFILGIDMEFKYKDKYIKFLLAIDKEIWKKFLSKALYLAQNGEKVDALVYLRMAYLLNKDNVDILYNYLRILEDMSLDNFFNEKERKLFLNTAFDGLNELSKIYPDFSLIYYHLGFHHYNRKNYTAAESAWKKAITLGVDEHKKDELIERINDIDAKVRYEEGYNLIINGMSEEGLVKLLPLEDEYSDWWNLMFFIGLAYRQLENYEKALKYFFKVLDLNTGHIETYNEIGLCFMADGKFDKAEKYFKEAQKMHIDSSDIWCNLGIVYLNQNKIDLAKEYINKAYELNPDDEITLAWKKHIENI